MMPLRKEEERRRRKINFCLMMYVASFVLGQKDNVLIVVTATTTEFFFEFYCFKVYIFLCRLLLLFFVGEERERERWKRTYFTRIATKKEVFLLFFSSDAHTPEERRK